MTYKGIVDKIEDVVNSHAMLYDFGYGQLSDIKVLDEDGDGANYPYAFLVPAGVSRNNQSQVFTFSLIIMEMALTPADVLTVQSDCIQYLNDIISVLRYDTTSNADALLNSSIQVFRERFQDDVAGATASFQIAIPDPISACDAPVGQWTTPSTESVSELSNSTFSDALLTIGQPCQGYTNPNQYRFTMDLSIESLVDTAAWEWRTINIVRYTPSTGEYEQLESRALTLLDPAGSIESFNWQQDFDFSCDDSETSWIQVYVGDSRDQAVIANALNIQGTIKTQYKAT